jgi:hypothetical protein
VPKLNREKLLEFIEFDQSEELDLEIILDYCEVEENESFEESKVIEPAKRKRWKFYKNKLKN